MRVLLAAYAPSGVHSGMGKWAQRIATVLTGMGHTPTLWMADAFPGLGRWGRLTFLVFPLALAARIWRHRSRFDVAVVHEPAGFWYGLLRRVSPSLPPMVLMCHNVESKVHRLMRRAAARGYARPTPWNRVTVPLLRLWQSDGAIRLADHVVCLSREDEEYIVRRLGRDPSAVTRKINGVEEEEIRAVDAALPRAQREPLVLFIGGWLDVKGRRLVPAIWAAVCARVPAARLTLVGTWLKPDAVLSDFTAADRATITVHPAVTDPEEMAELLQTHAVYLMPSVTEGSPLALLEAMAAGLPVVAAATGGIPDIVTHEVDGLLFPALDAGEAAHAVCRVLEDRALAERIGRAARERVRALTWRDSAKPLAAALERIAMSRERV